MLVQNPHYLVVDLYDVLKDCSQNAAMYGIYRHFPLQDMVSCILSVNAYGDDGEFFWLELENRFERNDFRETINYDVVSFFHELLSTYLDEYIRQKLPPHIDTGDYVFCQWVSNTSLILQKDNNARSSHSLM